MPKGIYSRKPLDERLWAKVDKDGPVPVFAPSLGPCWLWKGKALCHGYGQITSNYRHLMAYRVAYELLVGPIPPGLEIDHLCRVPLCVNPAHLEPVTRRENILRGLNPAAVNARKTHCIRGHEFNSENTRIRLDGKRTCRECERTGKRARRARSGNA